MKKIMCTLLIVAILFCGCAEETAYTLGKSKGTLHQQNFPFLPNEIGMFPIFIPSIFLVMKNINEANAIMEFEKKADAEFAQMKNPVYFME